jgi:apolipoprotein D and lipocalin family protein
MRSVLVLFVAFVASGCVGVPEGVSPVSDFDANQYLGKWYEIARLDHSFERGLDNVTAEYVLRDDGGVKVINRGYARADKTWKQVEGKAYFVGGRGQGHLRVSFFGPFYASYVVFALDKEKYQYAYVAGYNRGYLWLLARTPTVKKEIVDEFVDRCRGLGFDTDKLVFVKHY